MYITKSTVECKSVSFVADKEIIRNQRIANVQLIVIYEVYQCRSNEQGETYRSKGWFFNLYEAKSYVETKRSRGASWKIKRESRLLFQNAEKFLILDFALTYSEFKPFRKRKITLAPYMNDLMVLVEKYDNWAGGVYKWGKTQPALGQSACFISFDFYDFECQHSLRSDCTFSPFSHNTPASNVDLEWYSFKSEDRNEKNNFKAFLWFQKSILNAHNIR